LPSLLNGLHHISSTVGVDGFLELVLDFLPILDVVLLCHCLSRVLAVGVLALIGVGLVGFVVVMNFRGSGHSVPIRRSDLQ